MPDQRPYIIPIRVLSMKYIKISMFEYACFKFNWTKKVGMSVSDGSLIRHDGLQLSMSRSPIRLVRLRRVSDQACQTSVGIR